MLHVGDGIFTKSRAARRYERLEGQRPELRRVVPSSDDQFGAYAVYKQLPSGKAGQQNLPTYQLMVAGGLAGRRRRSARPPVDLVRARRTVDFRDAVPKGWWRLGSTSGARRARTACIEVYCLHYAASYLIKR